MKDVRRLDIFLHIMALLSLKDLPKIILVATSSNHTEIIALLKSSREGILLSSFIENI